MRSMMVVVTTENLDSAHRIFNVMNDRGLDLSPADIFKSQVIGPLGDGPDGDEYTRRWEDAEDRLGRDNFAEMFLHIRLIVSGRRAEGRLLKEFPEQVLNRYLPNRAGQFVDEVIVPYADAYHRLLHRSYALDEPTYPVNCWLTRLSRLDSNDWRPPALWALREHGDDPLFVEAFLAKLERLAASMFVRREYSSARAERYARLLTELNNGQGLEAKAFNLNDGERADTLKRIDGDLYGATKTRRYVLLRLDELLSNGSGVSYDHARITIEHVLPQYPSVTGYWARIFKPDVRYQWTHRLANLVLLNRYRNSAAQNYSFPEKKDKYFTGKSGIPQFALTVQVLHEKEWTPEVLERRQRELVDALRAEWSL
jgi:uncharacterized protein DUF1524